MHGNREFDCRNKSALKTLNEQLRKNGNVYSLNGYLGENEKITVADLTENQCKAVRDLYIDYQTIAANKDYCFGKGTIDCTFVTYVEDANGAKQPVPERNNELAAACGNNKKYTAKDCIEYLVKIGTIEEGKYDVERSECTTGKRFCDFSSLRRRKNWADKLKCESLNPGCIKEAELNKQLEELDKVFNGVDVLLEGETQNYSTTIPVGAAIGAGTGGLATAITAFVERNNINCRVGDGLNTVAFGKSHSIDTLKDFYVKWNLRLPDTVAPTETAVDCKSWKLACAQYTDLNQCKAAALNYKPEIDGTITLVRSACAVSGSVCIENAPVAKSYGACEQ